MTLNSDAPGSSGTTSPISRTQNEVLEQAESVVYKQVEDGPDLEAHIFFPAGHRKTDNRPAIVFFFGSSWDHGRVTQFAPHALYFAGRGAVTILADYRLASTHGSSPVAAMQDARSALRWIRFYASELGVDPDKVVASGASAGAHIAAAAVMHRNLEDDNTDPPLRADPDALMLFSPIVTLTKDSVAAARFASAAELKQANLYRYIRKGLPPSLVFHGTRDRFVPFESVRKFCRKMKRKRNACELIHFEGRENGFFNLNVDPVSYEYCVNQADHFLATHDFLEPSDEPEEDEIRLQSWREEGS